MCAWNIKRMQIYHSTAQKYEGMKWAWEKLSSGELYKCYLLAPISCPLNIHHVLILDDDDDDDSSIIAAFFFILFRLLMPNEIQEVTVYKR